jgi:hypothetical protein
MDFLPMFGVGYVANFFYIQPNVRGIVKVIV